MGDKGSCDNIIELSGEGGVKHQISRPTCERGGKVKIDLTRPFGLPLSFKEEMEQLFSIASDEDQKAQQENHGTSPSAGNEQVTALERDVAALVGKEAGLFFSSDLLPQLLALKLHSDDLDGCARFAVQPCAQVLQDQHKAYQHLLGLEPVMVGTANLPISLDDVTNALGNRPALTEQRVCCLVIELGSPSKAGRCPNWSELLLLRRWASTNGVAMMATGGYLWEAGAFYDNKSYAEVFSLFECVYMSLQHGLGAMGGGVLCGGQGLMKRARLLASHLGVGGGGGGNNGGRENLLLALSGRNALTTVLPSIKDRRRRLAQTVEVLSEGLVKRGYGVRFLPERPHTPRVHVLLRDRKDVLCQSRDAVLASTGILLFDSLRPWNEPRGAGGGGEQGSPIPSDMDIPGVVVDSSSHSRTPHPTSKEGGEEEDDEGRWYHFDWVMGPATAMVADEVLLDTWQKFFQVRHEIFQEKTRFR